ncbi:MAG: CsiV family protein [Woeseia sp.]
MIEPYRNMACRRLPAAQSRTARVIAACVALSGIALIAGAQQVTDSGREEPASAARYTVELIVFAYRSQDAAGNELFAPEPALIDEDPDSGLPAGRDGDTARVFDDRSLPAGSGQSVDDEVESRAIAEVPTPAAIELRLLESDQYAMQDIYRKLASLDAYRPIMHTAWQQTTHDKERSPALQLRALGNPPSGLDGTVTLYQGRFVHMQVDLSLDAAGNDPPSSSVATVSDHEDSLFRPPVRYQITEDRIMRQGEIRYFDHPRFGLIAKVTRTETGEPSRDNVQGAAGDSNQGQWRLVKTNRP